MSAKLELEVIFPLLQCQISWKWWDILRLAQWRLDRKPAIRVCQPHDLWPCMTSNSPKSRSHDFKNEYLNNGERYDVVLSIGQIGNLSPWMTLDNHRCKSWNLHIKMLNVQKCGIYFDSYVMGGMALDRFIFHRKSIFLVSEYLLVAAKGTHTSSDKCHFEFNRCIK